MQEYPVILLVVKNGNSGPHTFKTFQNSLSRMAGRDSITPYVGRKVSDSLLFIVQPPTFFLSKEKHVKEKQQPPEGVDMFQLAKDACGLFMTRMINQERDEAVRALLYAKALGWGVDSFATLKATMERLAYSGMIKWQGQEDLDRCMDAVYGLIDKRDPAHVPPAPKKEPTNLPIQAASLPHKVSVTPVKGYLGHVSVGAHGVSSIEEGTDKIQEAMKPLCNNPAEESSDSNPLKFDVKVTPETARDFYERLRDKTEAAEFEWESIEERDAVYRVLSSWANAVGGEVLVEEDPVKLTEAGSPIVTRDRPADVPLTESQQHLLCVHINELLFSDVEKYKKGITRDEVGILAKVARTHFSSIDLSQFSLELGTALTVLKQHSHCDWTIDQLVMRVCDARFVPLAAKPPVLLNKVQEELIRKHIDSFLFSYLTAFFRKPLDSTPSEGPPVLLQHEVDQVTESVLRHLQGPLVAVPPLVEAFNILENSPEGKDKAVSLIREVLMTCFVLPPVFTRNEAQTAAFDQFYGTVNLTEKLETAADRLLKKDLRKWHGVLYPSGDIEFDVVETYHMRVLCEWLKKEYKECIEHEASRKGHNTLQLVLSVEEHIKNMTVVCAEQQGVKVSLDILVAIDQFDNDMSLFARIRILLDYLVYECQKKGAFDEGAPDIDIKLESKSISSPSYAIGHTENLNREIPEWYKKVGGMSVPYSEKECNSLHVMFDALYAHFFTGRTMCRFLSLQAKWQTDFKCDPNAKYVSEQMRFTTEALRVFASTSLPPVSNSKALVNALQYFVQSPESLRDRIYRMFPELIEEWQRGKGSYERDLEKNEKILEELKAERENLKKEQDEDRKSEYDRAELDLGDVLVVIGKGYLSSYPIGNPEEEYAVINSVEKALGLLRLMQGGVEQGLVAWGDIAHFIAAQRILFLCIGDMRSEPGDEGRCPTPDDLALLNEEVRYTIEGKFQKSTLLNLFAALSDGANEIVEEDTPTESRKIGWSDLSEYQQRSILAVAHDYDHKLEQVVEATRGAIEANTNILKILQNINSHLTWEDLPQDCRTTLEATMRLVEERVTLAVNAFDEVESNMGNPVSERVRRMAKSWAKGAIEEKAPVPLGPLPRGVQRQM